jgi:hypothetical protein
MKKKVWALRQVISTITLCSHFTLVLTQKDDASSQKNSWLTALIAMIRELLEERVRAGQLLL